MRFPRKSPSLPKPGDTDSRCKTRFFFKVSKCMIDFTISRISGFQYYDSWQFDGCSEVHGHIKSGTIDSEVRILCAAISCGMDHRQRRSDCCAAQVSQFYGGKKHFVNPKVLVSRNQFMQFWRIRHHPDTSVQIDI